METCFLRDLCCRAVFFLGCSFFVLSSPACLDLEADAASNQTGEQQGRQGNNATTNSDADGGENMRNMGQDGPAVFLVKEDFEATGGYGSMWTANQSSSGAVEVSDEQFRGGAKSLKLTIPANGNNFEYAYLRLDRPSAPYDKSHYGRAYLRTGGARPGNEGLIHWDFVHASGESDPEKQFRFGGISDPSANQRHTWLWNHEIWPRPAGFDEIGVDDTGSVIPAQQWVCVEWHFDGNTNASRFWENGTERTNLNVTTPHNGQSFAMPTFESIDLGLWIFQERAMDFVLYLDDVAIADQRIGCL